VNNYMVKNIMEKDMMVEYIIYRLINVKGKVKEYYDDKLNFVGEYLNCKKSEKGKEYDYKGEI